MTPPADATLGLFLPVANAPSLGLVVTPTPTGGSGTTLLAALPLTITGTALNALTGMGRVQGRFLLLGGRTRGAATPRVRFSTGYCAW